MLSQNIHQARMLWLKKYSNSPLLCVSSEVKRMEALQVLAWGYLQVKLWLTKQLGPSRSRRRHFCMSADDSYDSIISSASPKKHRIILVPNLLKEAPVPYPSTIAIGIFAIHLKIPSFSAVVSSPWRDFKLKSKLRWSCQAGFLAVAYRARCHYFSERHKGRKLSN